MPRLITERLEIVTFTADMMAGILKGDINSKNVIKYRLAPEWPLDVYKQFFSYKIERFRKYPQENDWEGLIIDRKNQLVIGDMGFKGGPNAEGDIDLGYSIVPSYQGNGLATEMGKAMVEWGLSQQGVKRVVATCDPDNSASIRVLEKIGFQQINQMAETIYWSY